MDLISIKSKNKKRVGRGLSAGQGKTAGRGTKGQRSRSGFNIPRKFEGGQTPLSMRLSKMPGFTSHKRKAELISLTQVSENFKNGETITVESLKVKKLISGKNPVKVLNNGELTVAVKFDAAIRISKTVIEIIEKMEKKPAAKTETEKVEKKPVKKTKTADAK